MDNSLSLNDLYEIKNNIELALDKIDKLYKKELDKLDEIEREEPSNEWWAMWDETEENIISSVDTKGYLIEWEHYPDCRTPSHSYSFGQGQEAYEWCPIKSDMVVSNYLDLQDEIIKLQIKELNKDN